MGVAGGFVLHNADHVRRGFDVVRDGVIVGGTLAAMLVAVLFTVVVSRHASAPAVAAVVGLGLVVGVSAVHLLPGWLGTLSDSLPDGDVDGLTWVAVLTEILGAALVGVVGLQVLRRNDYAFAIDDWD
ncbi:MAG: hypothetical protein P8J50_07740 [Acidimicrobiales bacterium]|jgi:hypothetical protein|nr:hypothetical protein [Acidimicrobiales bacterium]